MQTQGKLMVWTKNSWTRFWSMIGQTILYAQKTFIAEENLNEFLDSGLIKILQKGGTKGKLIKDWRTIKILSQIISLGQVIYFL